MPRLNVEILTLLGFFAALCPASADTVFVDNTFNLSDYTQTPAFTSGAGATITAQQCASCGNPGAALQINEDAPSGSALLAQGFYSSLFTYNPQTQGAITSISASVDKDATFNFTVTNAGNTFRPLIEQDGNFYLAAISGSSFTGLTTGYITLSATGLVASDFQEFDFSTDSFLSGTPNFDGDPIELGLAQISSLGSSTPDPTAQIDYDNLVLGVSAAPLPSTWIMMLSALACFAFLANRGANKISISYLAATV
jgi:hypothetical protein